MSTALVSAFYDINDVIQQVSFTCLHFFFTFLFITLSCKFYVYVYVLTLFFLFEFLYLASWKPYGLLYSQESVHYILFVERLCIQ